MGKLRDSLLWQSPEYWRLHRLHFPSASYMALILLSSCSSYIGLFKLSLSHSSLWGFVLLWFAFLSSYHCFGLPVVTQLVPCVSDTLPVGQFALFLICDCSPPAQTYCMFIDQDCIYSPFLCLLVSDLCLFDHNLNKGLFMDPTLSDASLQVCYCHINGTTFGFWFVTFDVCHRRRHTWGLQTQTTIRVQIWSQ